MKDRLRGPKLTWGRISRRSKISILSSYNPTTEGKRVFRVIVMQYTSKFIKLSQFVLEYVISKKVEDEKV